MGSDRDGDEFFDAVGKRRTAKECRYEGDGHENAPDRERSEAAEQSSQHGSGQGSVRYVGRVIR